MPLDHNILPTSRRRFLATLGGTLACWQFGGRLTLAVPAANNPAKVQLRVLSYNIHHGEGVDGRLDLERIAKVIQSVKPDLVALQEVDHKTRRVNGVDQTAELARLTGLEGQFAKAIDLQGGGYGQAILSRFPLKDCSTHLLPTEPGEEQRIAVAATISLNEHQSLTFVGTHLHHKEEASRLKQSAKLNELFGGLKQPVILAGDLNATPESQTMRQLQENWQSTISAQPLASFPAQNPRTQIDYILTRPAARVRLLEPRILDEPVASDHRPLFAIVEIDFSGE